MDHQSFRQAIALLSGEHSLAILKSMRDQEWHLSSEIARNLRIHTTTASKFLQGLADLHLVERRPHDSRVSEYRLRSTRLSLEVDLLDEIGPVQEAVDFYVTYFATLIERIRRLGWPNLEAEMQRRLTKYQQELRALILQHLSSDRSGGLDRLQDFVAQVQRDLWAICSGSLGDSAAERVFEAAQREAVGSHPDLVARCGLTRPLEA